MGTVRSTHTGQSPIGLCSVGTVHILSQCTPGIHTMGGGPERHEKSGLKETQNFRDPLHVVLTVYVGIHL